MENSTLKPLPTPKDFKMSFNGSTSEYFKIWIVNIALTVLTLGLYLPWAKVRTRRYFYANTELDEHRFDYLADPKKMLKGYLIIYTAIILYILGINQIIHPAIGIVIIITLILSAPFLIAASLRFRLYNTSYRNVRFSFAGTTGDAYSVYWGYGFLTNITLGIMYPILKLKIFEYVFDNSSIGKSHFNYQGKGRPMYNIYLGVFLMGLAFFAVAVVSGVVLAAFEDTTGGETESVSAVPLVMMGIIYFFYIVIFAIATGYVKAKTLCYNLSVLSIGYDKDITFNSDLSTSKFAWLTFTNVFATIFSAGLLSPWAKIRASKMYFSSITVSSTKGDIGTHEALSESDRSATGEAAVDAMEFDVGF